MSLNPCTKCGVPVRLGAHRISVNRKRGVAHYLDHMPSSNCDAVKPYVASMLKPYPPREEDRDYHKMMERWNRDNPLAICERADDGAMDSDMRAEYAERMSAIRDGR